MKIYPLRAAPGVPSLSPANAVSERPQPSRVVLLSLLVTAAPTGGYELNRYHIRTYETGGLIEHQ